MTTDIERLRTSFKRLGLHTIADTFEREAQKAAKTKQSYVGFLAHLVDEELAAKADRSINARIARARFPAIRTLEAFDFTFQPSIPAPLIRELAELGFLERAENLLLIGPPGVGKSHLGIALGVRACAAHKRVLFRPVPELLDDLVAATVDQTLSARLEMLSRVDLLILDELGYLPMDARRANLFFQLISRRYEHGSVIVTSNKSFEEWGAIFGDDVIATAVLDRLLHHSHIIPITGPSYRTKDKQPSKREGR
ncbi:MAG: IS21-like element helper ATPase IstB [Armatimonadota bacterium]|nr:IS21-like element helper ATPase IstB [Armatimonadota bacterium]